MKPVIICLMGVLAWAHPGAEEAEEAFNISDENGDGKVTKGELLAGIQAQFDGDIPAESMRDIEKATESIMKFDQDGDGMLDLKEFSRAMGLDPEDL